MILRGRRCIVELQKWRNLNVFVNPFQNASAFYSSGSVSFEEGRKVQTFTVSYLVDSLGLPTKLAESISKKVRFEEKGKPDSVLSLLRSYGFTSSQISSIVTEYPRLLLVDAEMSLGPKLKFLQSRGASTSELTEIVCTVPKILGKKEGKCSSRYYDFVKEIIQDDKSSKLSHSLLEGTKQENKIRNVSVLREMGMPQRLLFAALLSDCGFSHGKERFEESLKKVVEMGFDPTSSKFVHALRIVERWKKETVEEKLNIYKRLGLSVGDVWAMFMKWPLSLAYSEKKINQTFESLIKCGLLGDEVLSLFKKWPHFLSASEQKISDSVKMFLGLGFSEDEFTVIIRRFPQLLGLSPESVKKKAEFLLKKMKWPLKALVAYPVALGYSMDKRIMPRCNVINVLMSKGLLGSEFPSMTSVLVCNNEVFLTKYVRNHDDKQLVIELMDVFTGKIEKNI